MNIVQAVEHESLKIVGQSSYKGKKDSEIICARTLLTNNNLEQQHITLDALHLCPKTTSQIEAAEGIYLISLKNNQLILLSDMFLYSQLEPALHPVTTTDKGHGRLEQRDYLAYDLTNIEDKIELDPRWNKSNLSTLIRVKRQIVFRKTKEEYEEVSFYLTNANIDKATECYKAIRNHWGVEVCNHIRDVTLNEDRFRTKIKEVSKVVASLRTLVINLLLKNRPKNLVAQLELFQDDFKALIRFLKKVNFL